MSLIFFFNLLLITLLFLRDVSLLFWSYADFRFLHSRVLCIVTIRMKPGIIGEKCYINHIVIVYGFIKQKHKRDNVHKTIFFVECFQSMQLKQHYLEMLCWDSTKITKSNAFPSGVHEADAEQSRGLMSVTGSIRQRQVGLPLAETIAIMNQKLMRYST